MHFKIYLLKKTVVKKKIIITNRNKNFETPNTNLPEESQHQPSILHICKALLHTQTAVYGDCAGGHIWCSRKCQGSWKCQNSGSWFWNPSQAWPICAASIPKIHHGTGAGLGSQRFVLVWNL